jgi:hypothetical protein
MKTWYSLNLGDAIMAHQPLEEIREALEKFVKQNGSTTDLAIFTRNDSEGRLHCEVTVFFSPNASKIGKLFGANPCKQPSHINLDLLVGNETCWETLFPFRV